MLHRGMRIRTSRLSLVLVAIVAATAPPAAAQDDSGLIAFESNRDGTLTEIYTMRPDGSAQTRLTHNGVRDISAAWSPDGSRSRWRAASATGSCSRSAPTAHGRSA